MSDEPVIEQGPVPGEDDPESATWRSWTGAPETGAPDDLVGVVLGGTYRLTRSLGEGAMGRVYEAQHTRIEGKRFAVKVLHPELVQHAELRERFHREAEAAALLDHPNAVSVFDVGETDDGRPFIVSELLTGEDLSDLLSRVRTLSVPRAVHVVRQVAKALAAAHERGVIHRDVKPDNVFLMGDPGRPRAKVLDFGISRLDKGGKQLTKLGTVIGTPSYMPPEQGRGQRVDHRADVYGLGAILYRALTGVAPHDKGNPADTLVDVLTQELVRPRALEPRIPEAIEQLIVRAMAREPEQRFATMQAFDDALAPFDIDEQGNVAQGALAPAAGAGAAFGSSALGRAGRAGTTAAPTILSRAPAFGEARLEALGAAGPTAGTARLELALLALLGSLWLWLALFGAVTGIALLAGAGGRHGLEASTAVLAALGAGCVLASACGALAFQHRAAWRDAALASVLADRLRAPVLAGLCAYGSLAVLVRAAESLLLGSPLGVGWPAWDLLLLVLSLSAAGGATLLWRDGRRPSERCIVATLGLVMAVVVVVAVVLVRGQLER